MKLALMQLFVVTLPAAVFLTTLLYGGISNTVIKQELAKSRIYQKVGEYVEEINSETIEDSESQQFATIIAKRFTPSYLQTKTETAIDDSFNWVTGKSPRPPVISFKEIKQDIFTEYPDLFASLETLSKDIEEQAAAASLEASAETGSENPQEDVTVSDTGKMLTTLIKNDFSIPLEKQLIEIKRIYSILRIAQIILVTLLVGNFIFMCYLAVTWTSRFKWMGATLIVSGIVGFGVILLNTFVLAWLRALPIDSSNEVLALIAPAGIGVATHFVNTYSYHQGIVSVAMIAVAAGCFVAAEITKPKIAGALTPASKPQAAKKK